MPPARGMFGGVVTCGYPAYVGMPWCGIGTSCGMEEAEAEENDEPVGTYGAESAAETPPRTVAHEGGGGGGGWPAPSGWPCN